MTSATTKTERFTNARKTIGDKYEVTMAITKGRKVEQYRYLAEPLAGDYGTAFHLTKGASGEEENEVYDVCLGQQATCDCKGFSRWHHCKHIESLTALLKAGYIKTKPAN